MAALLSVAGKPWAVELLWQTQHGRSAKSEAKKIAQSIGEDLMCIRDLPSSNYGVGAIQIGLANRRQLGFKGKWLPSLAAALATLYKGSWIGAFRLASDKYYAVMVKNELIVSVGGDQLFSNQVQLEQHINEFRGMFDAIYCYGIEIADAKAIDLASELNKLTEFPQLKATRRRWLPENFPWFRLVQFLVIIGLAINYFLPETLVESVAIEPTAPPPPTTISLSPPPAQPWPEQALASSFFNHCAEMISKAPEAIGGWETFNYNCDGKKLQLSLKRSLVGTPQDMLAVGASLNPSKTLAEWEQNDTTQLLGSSSPAGSDLEVKSGFKEIIEANGDSVTIQEPINPAVAVNQTPANWQEIHFSIQTNSDYQIYNWLDHIPGLRIKQIIFNPSATPVSKIDGVIYVSK